MEQRIQQVPMDKREVNPEHCLIRNKSTSKAAAPSRSSVSPPSEDMPRGKDVNSRVRNVILAGWKHLLDLLASHRQFFRALQRARQRVFEILKSVY